MFKTFPGAVARSRRTNAQMPITTQKMTFPNTNARDATKVHHGGGDIPCSHMLFHGIKKLDSQDKLGDSVIEADMTKAAHLEAIMATGRRIHEAIDALDGIVSARLGVHRNDLRCLHLLEAGPTTPSHVAAYTGLTSGSVTALLDRLENAGFIERCRSTEDRRSVAVAMPTARLEQLRAIYDEIGSAVRDEFASLNSCALAETGEALGRFADALAGYATRSDAAGCAGNPPICR